MVSPTEGYVLHTYGPDHYVRHAVASVATLRRHDTDRPVALFCPPSHQALLQRHGLDEHFTHVFDLPKEHRSIVGFKHSLHRFKPFGRSLFVDADMVWCRDPDPLWQQFRAFGFTATGQERADFFFGGPKGIGVVADMLLKRRQRTLERFGLSYLPRVQAGMIYAEDDRLTRQVAEQARDYLARADETHFRSRLNEGRTEESCEWSLAMAMSHFDLPIFPWMQGQNSPQLDFIEGMTQYDEDFQNVRSQYFTTPFIYSFRGVMVPWLRKALIGLATGFPGRNDVMHVTPYALHFGWLQHKQPFHDFADRTWARLIRQRERSLEPQPAAALTNNHQPEPAIDSAA